MVIFVLVVGWAVYVLPTPGDLTAWELAGALIPALLLFFGAVAMLGLVMLPFYLLDLYRRLRRRR